MKKLVIPQLNAQQYELMTTTEPNILCLASAGSGKTFAATARVEYFIRQHRVDPSDFLIISFSRTAASEMRERLKSSLSKKQFQKLFISTFHAYCRNVVIEQQTTLGIEAHRMKLIDERRLEGLFKVTAKRLLAREGITKDVVSDDLAVMLAQYPQARHFAKYGKLTRDQIDILRDAIEYLNRTVSYSYDDLLHLTRKLFLKNPKIARQYQARFKYVILDEAQDTAKSVFEVLRLLITQKHGFCAIGDIEQCLFGFAGCSPENLIAYANERGCHILTLHETFRFGPTIASLANRVVDDMDIEKRFKISTTTSQDSAPIASYPVEDPKLPQQQVLDIVNSWRNRGIPLSSMAVLCRTNKELSEYMALLNANGIACQNKGLSMLNRLEVKHMLSAVSLIQNNNLDDWITIINQYAIGVDSVTMSAVFEGFTGSLTQMKAHMAAKPIVGVGPGRINVISSMVDKILTMKRLIDAGEKDFYKLAEVINIRETKFIKTARLNAEGQSLAEERLEFLGVLTRLAKEYGPNIYGFREYLQTLMDYDGSDQHTRQAVNLLTVHKSKGMTLPYTILDTKRFFTMLDHPQAHLWEQFCLYVGITRAKYELHLFYDPNQPTAEYIVEDPLVRRQIRNQRLERESQAVASPLEQLKMMELGSGTVPIDIERLIHPTNNAVLVQVNGRETWIPKKALRVRGDHVFVSLWKAKELGLR